MFRKIARTSTERCIRSIVRFCYHAGSLTKSFPPEPSLQSGLCGDGAFREGGGFCWSGVKRFFFMVFVAFFSLSAFAQSLDNAQKQVVEEVRSYLNNMFSFQSDFVQTSPVGDVSKGKFYLLRPSKLRWQYDTPSPLVLTVKGNLLTYYDIELDEISYIPMRDNLTNFLTQEEVRFDQNIQVKEVVSTPNQHRLTVVDKKQPDNGKVTMFFSRQPLMLTSVEVTDQVGNQNFIAFTNPTLDAPVDKSLFLKPRRRNRL